MKICNSARWSQQWRSCGGGDWWYGGNCWRTTTVATGGAVVKGLFGSKEEEELMERDGVFVPLCIKSIGYSGVMASSQSQKVSSRQQHLRSSSIKENEKERKSYPIFVHLASYFTRLRCAASIITRPGIKSTIPVCVKRDELVRSTDTPSPLSHE
ncbi:hypothetical protein Tco_0963952 [Tanacetum coccineum]